MRILAELVPPFDQNPRCAFISFFRIRSEKSQDLLLPARELNDRKQPSASFSYKRSFRGVSKCVGVCACVCVGVCLCALCELCVCACVCSLRLARGQVVCRARWCHQARLGGDTRACPCLKARPVSHPVHFVPQRESSRNLCHPSIKIPVALSYRLFRIRSEKSQDLQGSR